jgi:hypothetical protein
VRRAQALDQFLWLIERQLERSRSNFADGHLGLPISWHVGFS